MSRLRVLHVIQNLNYGGMERVLADLVLGIDRTRFEPAVLCLQYLGRYSEELRGHAELHLVGGRGPGSLLRPTGLASRLRELRPDVVHSHSGVWFKVARAARMASVPRLVHTDHGRAHPDPLPHRLVDGIAARQTDVVVAVSQRLADQMARTLHVPRARLEVIANGIDTESYHPRADDGALRAEIGVPMDAPIIGSIGRLEPIKGFDVMIEAFAAYRRRGGRAHLVVAGAGSHEPALRALVAARGLVDSAHLLGWRNDPHNLLRAFSLFTMSSHSEGTSIGLLEAMSAGLVPVVTAVGGSPAVLGDALAHRLVPAAAPDRLADAWEAVLADADARAREGALARARVRASYSVDTMVRAYERVYDPAGPARPLEARTAPRAVPATS